MNDQLVIYASRWKSVLLATVFLATVCILVIFMTMLLIDSSWGPWNTGVLWIMCGISVIYLVCFLRSVISNLLRREPLLIVDTQGIYDNASFMGVGHIKWEDISKIYTYRYLYGYYLCIIPRDYDSILSRQPFVKRILMRINSFMTHSFEIPSILFDGSFNDIKQFVQKFFEITT